MFLEVFCFDLESKINARSGCSKGIDMEMQSCSLNEWAMTWESGGNDLGFVLVYTHTYISKLGHTHITELVLQF